MNLKELADQLDILYKTEGLPTVNDCFDSSKSELVSKMSNLAYSVLTEDGIYSFVPYTYRAEMRKYGYRVYAGDQDSFGWLVGCVRKEDSDITLTFG